MGRLEIQSRLLPAGSASSVPQSCLLPKRLRKIFSLDYVPAWVLFSFLDHLALVTRGQTFILQDTETVIPWCVLDGSLLASCRNLVA